MNLYKLALIALLNLSAQEAYAAELTGLASWYGGGEKLNRHTANGEIFNPERLTCASYAYPLGTLLKVTNPANGKSVKAWCNDRGPSRKLNRLVDLSRGAFCQIADLRKGIILVEIEEESAR